MDQNLDLTDYNNAAFCNSFAKQQQIFDQYLKLKGPDKCLAALALFQTPYHDLFEAVLDTCTEDWVDSDEWQECLKSAIGDDRWQNNNRVAQAILILLQRMESSLKPEFTAFYRKCLDSSDNDVRYQAFCLAELQEENSEDYLERIKKWIQSDDEDFRIVSIQALERLKPEWAAATLKKRAEKAVGVEAFHIVLAQLRVNGSSEREELTLKLMQFVDDDRYSFAAIRALAQYGTKTAVPALLNVARSFLAEPTLRVAAAGAAAKLGSDTGMQILLKFSQSRHGNPKYASELLSEIEQSKICDNR